MPCQTARRQAGRNRNEKNGAYQQQAGERNVRAEETGTARSWCQGTVIYLHQKRNRWIGRVSLDKPTSQTRSLARLPYRRKPFIPGASVPHLLARCRLALLLADTHSKHSPDPSQSTHITALSSSNSSPWFFVPPNPKDQVHLRFLA